MKSGISTIIAIVLIIMITVVVASATFYWMTKVQGEIQGRTESSQTELIEQVSGEIEIKSFEHNSNLSTAEVIMQNTGTRELKDLGDTGDLLTIYSGTRSCTIEFYNRYCDVCPFDLGVGGTEVVAINFTNSSCEDLKHGVQYNAYFAFGDDRVYTSFTADITQSSI